MLTHDTIVPGISRDTPHPVIPVQREAPFIYVIANRTVIDQRATNSSSPILWGRIRQCFPGHQALTWSDWFTDERYSEARFAELLRGVDAVAVWPYLIRSVEAARAVRRPTISLSGAIIAQVRVAKTGPAPIYVLTPSRMVPVAECQVSREPVGTTDLLRTAEAGQNRYELWLPRDPRASAAERAKLEARRSPFRAEVAR